MAVRAQPGSGAEEGEVLITVQDRGQGIEPSEIPHIFEPFYRGNAARASQARGTGLGLSLAKEAAEAMGGKLTVASRVGEGTRVSVHLPLDCERVQPGRSDVALPAAVRRSLPGSVASYREISSMPREAFRQGKNQRMKRSA